MNGGGAGRAPVKPGRPARKATMLEVLQQFRVLVRSIRAHYDRVEKKSGMSGAQLWAMARIAARPGITVGELAAELAIHQSTASNMLERLAALGLVEKRRGKDQRVVTLFASARGKAVVQSAPQPLIGVLQQALSELPPERLDSLHAHLAELVGLMRIKGAAGARAMPLSSMLLREA